MTHDVPETLDRTIAGRRLEIVRRPGARAEGRAAVVLLHEGLGCVSLWRDLPARIAESTGRDVIAYSRFGYGRSESLAGPRTVAYMHDEALCVLPELLASLRLAPPILLGHSDGASIALIFAGSRPAEVAGLILEAPHVFVEDLSVASIARAKTTFETTDLRARLARHHADPESTFRGWNDAWLDPRFRAWNIEAFLAPIRVPVLVVQGRDDEYGTLAQVEAIAARTRSRVVLFERCGHAPHRDRAEDTLAEIVRFSRELDTSPVARS